MQHGEKNKEPENLFSFGKADFLWKKQIRQEKIMKNFFTSKRLTTIKHS